MKALIMVFALMSSGVAFAEGTATKITTKQAKAECKAEAKKNHNKRLSKAEMKECVAAKTK